MELGLQVAGVDAIEAMDAVKELFEQGFNELDEASEV